MQLAAELPRLVIDVVNLDIMPHLASTKKQFVTNVAKWVICRKYAGANKAKLQENHTNL